MLIMLFSVKPKCLFTVQSPICPPGNLCVAKSIMALELRKQLCNKNASKRKGLYTNGDSLDLFLECQFSLISL